jgi:hypothetical protein
MGRTGRADDAARDDYMVKIVLIGKNRAASSTCVPQSDGVRRIRVYFE